MPTAWFVEFKGYLYSRQICSKNKLVHENAVTRTHRKLLAPGYGLLVINDIIMTSLLLLKVINVLAISLILSDALPYILSIFRFGGGNRWNLDSANKFNNRTS